jgi:short-subunit dehydrogenase
MSAADAMSFSERYGRWAIVIGASEGVGACAADELAARGLDLLLLARNQSLLDEVATAIRSRHGVEVRTQVQDLTAPGAAAQIVGAAKGLEVGLLIYTPGAVHNTDLFLDQPLELPMRMIQLNCTVPVALVHALAPAMRDRGRGGIVLVGSTGCFVGGPRITAYSAGKAFQVNLVEGLWAELQPHGVDVLSAVIGSTNTPARARTLGVDHDESQDMTSEAVARDLVEHIGDGPIRVIASDEGGIGPLNAPWSEFRSAARRALTEAMQGFTARTSVNDSDH